LVKGDDMPTKSLVPVPPHVPKSQTLVPASLGDEALENGQGCEEYYASH